MLLENKKKFRISRGGFTLIEIIVVMAIVAVLSTLSIAGYLQYRRSAIIDLSADGIVSQINSQRDKAALGIYKGQTAKCFMVLFEKNPADGKFSAYTSQKDFSGKKKWIGDSWVYEGCHDGTAVEKTPLELDSLVKIDNVSVGNFAVGSAGNSTNSLEVRFLPPDGKTEVVKDGDANALDLVTNGNMKIDISYGDNSPDFNRSILFDFNSGTSSISK